MESVKCTFKYAFIGIVVFLVLLYGFYRYTFNGYLSDEISDWTAFVSIFNGIGVLLLTALNVWVFYKLTILIAENEEKHRLYDKRKDALNNFIRSIYAVLTPDIEDPICEINHELLGKVYRKLELMKTVYAPICKEFSDDDFANFVEEFRLFCLDCLKEKSAEAEGKDIQREAFDIYMKALHLEMKIGEAMNAK